MKTESKLAEVESIAGICEVQRLGERAADFLIELPHGATRGAHFDALRTRLRGDSVLRQRNPDQRSPCGRG